MEIGEMFLNLVCANHNAETGVFEVNGMTNSYNIVNGTA